MEEISPAMAVPFMLGSLIYEDSALKSKTHIEINGLDLITSRTSLLTEHPTTNFPLVSIGTGNGGSDCNSCESEASTARTSAIEQTRAHTEMVTGDGNALLSSDKDEEYRALKSIRNIPTFDNSNRLETNTMPKTVVNNEVMVIESDRNLSVGLVEVPQEKKIRTSGQNVLDLCCIPLWGCQAVCGKRSEMEDAVVAVPSFLRIPTQMPTGGQVLKGMNQGPSHITAHFFGVYDGHGGCQVANYCRDRIHLALAEEIEIAEESRDGRFGSDCEELWKKAFLSCFLKVDAEVGGVRIGNRGIADTSEDCLEPVAHDAVGSTAVVAIISPTHLIVANCGDSRAVLCRGKVAVPLSVDHKPDREDERTRIEAAGGKVIQWDGFRVSGVLAMSRSIGDRYLNPYVIPDPEMVFVPRAKEDECLILASDGLWDVVTNEEACDVARKRILLWHKRNNGVTVSGESLAGVDPAAQDAADYLSRLALHKGSNDNISVIVVDLKAQRKFKKRT
ncbi:protein phosphatase 2C 50-like [Actinidia eriantha]|uniref:protein phosphatase 2C 50-like n=1 Tax=Actinidia eriantha TaxID=165200 RepID=UPI002587C59C|nr:protein phosphatase 2C 50-like [Actinidia eriantha]